MGSPELDLGSGALVGRERECAAIDRLLEASAQGESSSLVIRGEAGMGKTALLEYAAERSGGRTVLRVAGVEGESDLGFAGLDGLMRPIVDRMADLPEAQAEALSGALGLAASRPGDRLLVSAAALSLLAAAADEGPLLCLIDDVQFLDVASAEALVFSARRLAAEPVAMIFAVREGAGREFAAPGLPKLALESLAPEEAARLLESSAPAATEPVRNWLLAQAAGNPLALLELPVGLTAPQLQGHSALPETTPLTSGLREAFAQRIDRLPADTQTALLIAALDDREEVAAVMGASGEAGLAEDSLDAAEREGLLRVSGRHAQVPPSARAFRAARVLHAQRAQSRTRRPGSGAVRRPARRPPGLASGTGESECGRGGRGSARGIGRVATRSAAGTPPPPPRSRGRRSCRATTTGESADSRPPPRPPGPPANRSGPAS